jgi:hypothetical protein
MIGIPVESHIYVYGDNQSVLANTTVPHSNLKKKSNAIAFHFVREGTARDDGELLTLTHMITHLTCLLSHFPQGRKGESFAKWYCTTIEEDRCSQCTFGELPFVFMFIIFVLVENPIMFYVCIG